MLATEKIPDDYPKYLSRFEIAAGGILQVAWGRIDALQLTDRVCLVEHCSNVLLGALKYPDLCSQKTFARTQECRVVRYLRDLFVHLVNDAFESKNVMNSVVTHSLVERLIKYLTLNVKFMDMRSKIWACEALAGIFDTDEYTSAKVC